MSEEAGHHSPPSAAPRHDSVVYGPWDGSAPEIVDAEVVETSDQPSTELATVEKRRDPITVRVRRVGERAGEVARKTRHVCASAKTTKVGLHTALTWYGIPAAAGRAWTALAPTSVHNRMIRACQAEAERGNTAAEDRLRFWEERREVVKAAAHERRLETWRAFPALLRSLLLVPIVAAALLLVLGLVVVLAPGLSGGGWHWDRFVEPVMTVVNAIAWSWWAVTTFTWVIALAALLGAVYALHRVGAQWDALPAWAANGTQQEEGEIKVDERSLAVALRSLRIKELNDHFKAGLPLEYRQTPHRVRDADGQDDIGITAVIALPGGVAAAEVVEKRRRLAASLRRNEIEVWPSKGEDESELRLWVADRGGLDTPVGDWPWLNRDEPVDLYDGVPVGQTLAGQPIVAPMDGAAYLVGGAPGQGKSVFVRSLLSGALLDPRADVRVHVCAKNNDYSAAAPRLSKLVTGFDEDVHVAIRDELRELWAELKRRGEYIDGRFDSAREAGFPPIMSIFDEVHAAFQTSDKEVRGEICKIAEDLAKFSRKYGITTVYATQDAAAGSIPTAVSRQAPCRVAYRVSSWQANDGILGSGRYREGISATVLRPGTPKNPGDRGKAVTIGLTEDPWAFLRGAMVPSDKLGDIAARGVAFQEAAGTSGQVVEPDAPRVVLDDIATAAGSATVRDGEERPRAAAVAAEMARLWPAEYSGFTGDAVRQALAAADYAVPSTDRKYPIDPAKAAAAAARGKAGEAAEGPAE